MSDIKEKRQCPNCRKWLAQGEKHSKQIWWPWPPRWETRWYCMKVFKRT